MNQTIKPNYAELGRRYGADYRTVKLAYELTQQQKKTSGYRKTNTKKKYTRPF